MPKAYSPFNVAFEQTKSPAHAAPLNIGHCGSDYSNAHPTFISLPFLM